jgi:hypothetical protein
MKLWILFPALVLTVPALPAETNHSWETLRQTIKIGKKVVVSPIGDKKVEGKLIDIKADSITVQTGAFHKQDVVVARDKVQRVRYADIRMRNTLIGLGVGAVAGAIIGGTMDTDSVLSAGQGAAAFGAMCGGIGAAVGGAMPIGKPLYEIPKPVKQAANPVSGPERR